MIDEKAKVEVESVGRGSVSYQLDTDRRVKRRWDRPGIVKMIPLDEIREAMSSHGGEILFREHLYVKDNKFRLELDLPVDDDNDLMGDAEIKEMLTGNPNKLKDSLPKLSHEIKQRVAEVAAEMRINNMNKLQFIKEETGIDVYKRIEHLNEKEKDKKE